MLFLLTEPLLSDLLVLLLVMRDNHVTEWKFFMVQQSYHVFLITLLPPVEVLPQLLWLEKWSLWQWSRLGYLQDRNTGLVEVNSLKATGTIMHPW